MKKLVLLMLLVGISGIAQKKVIKPKPVSEVRQGNTVQWEPADENSLTQDEYNYLTKGLAIQKNSGLDVKKGYEFVLIKRQKYSDYTFTSNAFIETATKTLKAISIEVVSGVTNKTYYLALPTYGTAFGIEYSDMIMKFDAKMSAAYNVYLSEMFRAYYKEYYANKK